MTEETVPTESQNVENPKEPTDSGENVEENKENTEVGAPAADEENKDEEENRGDDENRPKEVRFCRATPPTPLPINLHPPLPLKKFRPLGSTTTPPPSKNSSQVQPPCTSLAPG